MMTVPVSGDTVPATAYALAASPARYMVERSDWKGASALEVRTGMLPYTTAISWFAKGLGASRSGDTAQAQSAITELAVLRDQLREKRDAYWSGQVDIQAMIVTAWTQLATGDQDCFIGSSLRQKSGECPSRRFGAVIAASRYITAERRRRIAAVENSSAHRLPPFR